MNYVTPFAALTIAATSVLTVNNPAEAASSYCYETVNNDTVCIISVHQSRSNPQHKVVRATMNGSGIDTIDVTCNPNHRYSYRKNLAGIACFLFN